MDSGGNTCDVADTYSGGESRRESLEMVYITCIFRTIEFAPYHINCVSEKSDLNQPKAHCDIDTCSQQQYHQQRNTLWIPV